MNNLIILLSKGYRIPIILILCNLIQNTNAQAPIYSSNAVHHPIVAENGMVSSQHMEATKVGLRILENGGNAIDAAVAVGFSLAVVLPRAGNLGGGGFMLIHDQKTKENHALNYREMAPILSDKDMFLDANHNVDNTKFNQSYSSIGVPGTVAGLGLALEKYGTMTLAEVLQPAIGLAENGFPVTYDLAGVLKKYEDRLKKCEATAKIFYKPDGTYYAAGEILVQEDLAWSLKQIATQGIDAFYNGEISQRIIRDVQKNNGILSDKDFSKYVVEESQPVQGTYRGYDIISMPPPSSGGVHIIQMLNILEGYPIGFLGHNTAQTLSLMAESMRLAYADRSKHLGDPLFFDVPTNGITDKAYAKILRKKIKPFEANVSTDILPGEPSDFESEETTHFSVVDKHGNVVSNTYTLNFSFGTGLVAKGTGIILNNEMGDFSAKPGVPNAFGLIGGEANAVEPGKRPLSSMTPTMVFKDHKPYLVTGSPGGSRIITAVLQVIMNVIDHDMNVADASHVPRIHHQWLPDLLYYEQGLNRDTRNLLEARGYTLKQRTAMGSTQSILLKNGRIYGSSDPRRPDALTLGY